MDINAMLLEALGDHPLMTPEELLTDACEGRVQLWCGMTSPRWQGTEAFLFTRLVDYPTGERALECAPAGGNLAEVLANAGMIEEFARMVGATQMLVHAGREGWARALKPRGYEQVQVTLRKLL